jgi:hypothetical protein
VLLAVIGTLHGEQSYAGLGVMIGLERRAVKKAIDELEQKKRIERTIVGEANIKEPRMLLKLLTSPKSENQSATLTEFNAADALLNAADTSANAADAPSNAAESATTISTISTLLSSTITETAAPLGREKIKNIEVNNCEEEGYDYSKYLAKIMPIADQQMNVFKFSQADKRQIRALFRGMGEDWLLTNSPAQVIREVVAQHRANQRPGNGSKFLLYKLKNAVSRRAGMPIADLDKILVQLGS